MTQERIVAAAILLDGGIHSVPPPGRHHDVIRKMFEEGLGTQTAAWEQGFLTSLGRFARRKPACLIARAAGQIREKTFPPDTLFSEDLW